MCSDIFALRYFLNILRYEQRFTNRRFFSIMRSFPHRNPLFLIFHTLLSHSLSFLPSCTFFLYLAHIFFPFSGRNPRSFIYSPLKPFSSNRSSAVRMSIKCHSCEMGSLHPFRGTRVRCNITWLHRARSVWRTKNQRMRDKRKSEKNWVAGKKMSFKPLCQSDIL